MDHPLTTALLLAVVLAAAVCDIATRRIFNVITYPAIVAGVACNAWLDGWPGVASAVAGFAVGFGPMLVAYLIGGYGGGDAKLMGAVGAIGGPFAALSVLFYGLLVGVAMGMLEVVWRGQALATLARSGRALWLLLSGARPSDPTTPQSPKVRLGLAIAIGAAWYVTEEWLGTTVYDTVLNLIR